MENAAYLVRSWFWCLPPFFMDRLSFVDEIRTFSVHHRYSCSLARFWRPSSLRSK